MTMDTLEQFIAAHWEFLILAALLLFNILAARAPRPDVADLWKQISEIRFEVGRAGYDIRQIGASLGRSGGGLTSTAADPSRFTASGMTTLPPIDGAEPKK